MGKEGIIIPPHFYTFLPHIIEHSKCWAPWPGPKCGSAAVRCSHLCVLIWGFFPSRKTKITQIQLFLLNSLRRDLLQWLRFGKCFEENARSRADILMHIHEWSADLNADNWRGKRFRLTRQAYQWQTPPPLHIYLRVLFKGRVDMENVVHNEQQFVFVHSVWRQMHQQNAMLLTHFHWKTPCGPFEPSFAL